MHLLFRWKLVICFMVVVYSVESRSPLVSNNPTFHNSRSTNTNVNPPRHSRSDQEQLVIDAIQNLALDLSATQWDQRNAGNVVMSPLSISSLLSLIMLGARGASHSELKVALSLPNYLEDDIIHETYRKVLSSLDNPVVGTNISMSVGIFLQSGLPILGKYTKKAKEEYDSEIQGLDFQNNAAFSTDVINKWVENSTYGKIKDLFSFTLPKTTRFVAVNTIYFNGAWELPFDKPLTNKRNFDTGQKNISIPMMSQIMNNVLFLNAESIGLNMIALPYKGGRYAMVIITPTGKPGFESILSLEYRLDNNVIRQLIGKMKPEKVHVTIPRMKLKNKINLEEDLKILQVKSIFDEQTADFGRLTTETGLFVDEIVHEAIIEVTESGTVAAAATATSFDRIGGNEVFQMNKPSLIFIKDMTNELTLFYARVIEPEPIF